MIENGLFQRKIVGCLVGERVKENLAATKGSRRGGGGGVGPLRG